MNMKRNLLVLALVLSMVPGIALAQDDVMKELGTKAAAEAMTQLGFEKGDENILAMTDAGYAMIDGQTTEAAIDGVSETCGCTVGKANLLPIHRSKFCPLWFFIYNKKTDEALFLQVDESADLAGDDVFSINSKEMIDAEYMLNNPEEWNKKFGDKVFCGNEFSLITIANIWAHPDTTYDFLQAAMLHNHLCPGVTSGYLISKYVEDELPITDPANQSYKVIACPVWCKEDAFQAVWDATPGKRGMYVKGLTGENKAALPDYAKDAAGLYIRWDGSSNSGDGLVVGFNFTELKIKHNIVATDDPWDWWTSRFAMDLAAMEYMDQPEEMCITIKEFQVDNDGLTQLQEAGVNPYVYLEIVEAPICLGVVA